MWGTGAHLELLADEDSIFPGMSRVSRLEEIRKRREVKSGNVELTEEPENGKLEKAPVEKGVNDLKEIEVQENVMNNLNDLNEVNNLKEKTVDRSQEETDRKPEQNETSNRNAINESSIQPIPNALNAEEQEKLFRDVYDQTGVFEPERIQPEKSSSYNSDLKNDLAPLYNRARHGTERAINAIIQKKYQESMGRAT